MPKRRKFDIPSRKEIIALLIALEAVVTDKRLKARIARLIHVLRGVKLQKGKKRKGKGNPLAKKAMTLARKEGISLKAAWKRVR